MPRRKDSSQPPKPKDHKSQQLKQRYDRLLKQLLQEDNQQADREWTLLKEVQALLHEADQLPEKEEQSWLPDLFKTLNGVLPLLLSLL